MKNTGSIRCILIDDHEEEHELFALGLKASALPVICHYYFFADEAFNALYHRHGPLPSVIFLDMNMPRMNGLEFLQKVKRIEHLKNIPIYVLTLGEFDKHREEMLSLGAVDYIIKPE